MNTKLPASLSIDSVDATTERFLFTLGPMRGRLSVDEHRAMLASWASDANAVPGQPTLRKLPTGPIVKVADIIESLKALDTRGRDWLDNRNRDDDDDDPPPCPVCPSVRPRGGGGAAFNMLSPVAA